MRVVVLSHAHPTFSKGGGEFAAHYLYQGIKALPGHEAWFVGHIQRSLLNAGNDVDSIAPGEYLIGGSANIYALTSDIKLDSRSEYVEMLRTMRPDVIHFHHYVNLGLELIRVARRACPNARIVVTLHEFIAICNHNGQMIKTDGRLCHQSSPRECHLCFPQHSPADFFLRERYIKTYFGLVDAFISPSKFLRDRYVAWGIPEDRIHVLENGLPPGERIPPRPLRGDDIRGRFAYFGQINPYKGVDIVLEAFVRLPKRVRKKVSLDIFGSALRSQAPDFQAKIEALLQKGKSMVRLHGPYEPEEMGRLMTEVDWAIMGSIWWENSPLVIQEAYKFGRPMICPDIGGMAEKVKPGVGGLHYRARDSVSLAAVIQRIVDEPELFDQLQQTLPAYPDIREVTQRHLELYRSLPGHGAPCSA